MQEEKVLEDVQNEDVSAGVTPEDIEANKIDIYRNFKRAERKVNSLLPEKLFLSWMRYQTLGSLHRPIT